MNLLLNFFDRYSRFFIVDGYAHDLAARFFQTQNFSHCSFYVSGLGRTHALNSNLVVTPDNYAADIDGPGLVSQEHGFSLPHNDQSSTPPAPR
ncbi:hypothetical protein D3C80_1506050 [compost metagenome]